MSRKLLLLLLLVVSGLPLVGCGAPGSYGSYQNPLGSLTGGGLGGVDPTALAAALGVSNAIMNQPNQAYGTPYGQLGSTAYQPYTNLQDQLKDAQDPTKGYGAPLAGNGEVIAPSEDYINNRRPPANQREAAIICGRLERAREFIGALDGMVFELDRRIALARQGQSSTQEAIHRYALEGKIRVLEAQKARLVAEAGRLRGRVAADTPLTRHYRGGDPAGIDQGRRAAVRRQVRFLLAECSRIRSAMASLSGPPQFQDVHREAYEALDRMLKARISRLQRLA